jgi:hypothetical protein
MLPLIPRYNVINAEVVLGLDGRAHLQANVVTRPFIPEGGGEFAGPNQLVVTPPLISRFPGGMRTEAAEYQVLSWASGQPTNVYTDIEEKL